MKRRDFLKTAAGSVVALANPAIVSAQSKRVLKFIPQSDLAVVDPIWTPSYVTRNHGYMVYDTLFGTDAESKAVPQMAEGGTVDDSGKDWTIRLRKGLSFHDGQPVTAADCVASIKRWGQRDPFGQALIAATDELSAKDEHTISFRLKSKFPLLLNALGKPSSNLCAIMPERLAKIDAFTQVTEVVGSGPFRFKPDERLTGTRVVYEKFDKYKPTEVGTAGWTSGPKIVHFDRVEWTVIPDSATASNALLRGEADWWEYPLPDLLPILQGNNSVRLTTTDPTGFMGTCRMNTLNKPFDNPAIRRAVLSAINQKDFMEAQVGGAPTPYKTGVGVFCPGTPFASDAGLGAIGSGLGNLDNVARAIKQAGYGGEKVVILSATDQPTSKIPADVLSDLLQRLGMNVEYQAVDWGTLIQRRTNREGTDKGGWSLYCSGWSGSDQLNPANHALLRGNALFFGWLKSDELETLRNEWFAAPDLAAQKEAARRIQKQALEVDVPYLPLGQFIQPTAHRANITGILPGFATFWNVRRV